MTINSIFNSEYREIQVLKSEYHESNVLDFEYHEINVLNCEYHEIYVLNGEYYQSMFSIETSLFAEFVDCFRFTRYAIRRHFELGCCRVAGIIFDVS